MKKTIVLLIAISTSTLLINCKSQDKKIDFSLLTTNYFKEKSALNPLEATQYGQNEYNDQLQFEMTDS